MWRVFFWLEYACVNNILYVTMLFCKPGFPMNWKVSTCNLQKQVNNECAFDAVGMSCCCWVWSLRCNGWWRTCLCSSAPTYKTPSHRSGSALRICPQYSSISCVTNLNTWHQSMFCQNFDVCKQIFQILIIWFETY